MKNHKIKNRLYCINLLSRFLQINVLSAILTFVIVYLLKISYFGTPMLNITAMTFAILALFLSLTSVTILANVWQSVRENTMWRLLSFFLLPLLGTGIVCYGIIEVRFNSEVKYILACVLPFWVMLIAQYFLFCEDKNSAKK